MKIKGFLILLPIVAVLMSLVMGPIAVASANAPETRTIVILGTSDIHGNIRNYDYFSDSVPTGTSRRGLTKVFTYVQGVRATNPYTLLIDNGDTIQGNPLAYYFDVIDPAPENPLAATMDAMGYVAATVGNHEFNYGPDVLNKYKSEASFPILSANVTGCRDYSFEPYTIVDVSGVQVGILGLTPPAVVHWERPENIVDCVFEDAVTAAQRYVPEMRDAGADVIVVAAHTGLDETYGYGREENFAKFLANEVPGIDVILAGHAHSVVTQETINGVLITEPGYWARNISDIRVTVSGSGTDWAVTAKSSTAPAIAAYAEDPSLLTLTQPYHDATVAYINQPIGTSTAAFPGGWLARIQDSPLPDLINQVQMDAAAAAGYPVDASLAALFTDSGLPAGDIKLKDAYAIYIYDNTLYVIEATGQQIKDELEWTADYFNRYYFEPTGVTKNTAVRDYNYDMWSGIEYKLDITKPVGQRVVELKLNGQPLAMDQVVRVALNNYRATGKFPTAPRLYQSTTEVRELIVQWIEERGTISPSDVFVKNWTLVPSANLWLNPADHVARSEYADLLWAAFDRSPDEYMRVPSDRNQPGTNVNREEGLFLLGNKAMDGLWDIAPDMSVLKAYTDQKQLSSWAKMATARAVQAGIFVPTGNQLLPKQLLTNGEALSWVREARFPPYTFLSTNDFHGQLEPKLVSGSNAGGAAYNMTYINEYRSQNPFGTLLMDAGDFMQGTPISNLLKGESTVDVFNRLGYVVSVVGNHEFDWGQATLQERMAQANFPILLANVFNAGTDTRPDWMTPAVMLTVKGQQIGVIGVTSKDTPTIVMAGNVAGLEFREAGPVVSELAAELRSAGADLVVVLAHMPGSQAADGTISGELVGVAVNGVDLIIAGHSHVKITGKINNIPVIEQYNAGTALGVSNLVYDRLNRNILSSNLSVVTTWNAGKIPDSGIAALVQYYKDLIAPIVNQLIATTTGPILRAQNTAGESAMGNLIADAQRWKAGTQLAFMNPGGIRADLTYTSYPANIIWGDLYTVQPFDNKLVKLTLTGSQIYDVLEQQFPPNQTTAKMLQISGLRYSYNLALPVGSRIVSVQLEDGTPILKDPTPYTVVANEFIATGGDKFTAFLGATNVAFTTISDLDALIEYLLYRYGIPPANTPIDPTVYPRIEGRITKLP